VQQKHKFLYFILKIALGVSLLGSISCYSQDDFSDDGDDHLETSLEDYRKENQEIIQNFQNNQGGDKMPSPKNMDFEKLKPLVKSLNSVYGQMSFDESKRQVEQNISQSPAKGLIKVFPKTVDFMTHLLRDDKALLGLIDMLKDKKKLTFFLAANIFTIFLGFLLRRMASKGGGVFQRLFRWVFRKTFIFGLRIYILIFFFGTELAPTFSIFKNVFL